MAITRGMVLPVAGLLAVLGSRGAAADVITVGGSVSTPSSVSSTSLGGSTVTAGGTTYGGSTLYGLVSAAGLRSPAQVNGNPNGNLLDYIVVTSTSGQSVLLSEGEIDPGFGGSAGRDIIANTANGITIAPQLIVSGDVNGGVGGRNLGNVASITVFQASPGPAPVTGGPSTQVSVSGAVASPTSYGSLAGLPQTTQTDSYQSGTRTTTTTFTGTQVFTLLSASGLDTTPSAILNDYVVATGTDGYAVVYSLAELDPAYFANPAGEPLVAAVSGSSGAFRSTAPGDVKGGRYVSNLENLNVVTAVPEPASLALLAVPLLGLALGRSVRRGAA